MNITKNQACESRGFLNDHVYKYSAPCYPAIAATFRFQFYPALRLNTNQTRNNCLVPVFYAPPPSLSHTYSAFFEEHTRELKILEIYLVHHLRGTVTNSFKAFLQLVFAPAPFDSRRSEVPISIARAERQDLWEAFIMGTAACICSPEFAKVVIIFGFISRTTPFCSYGRKKRDQIITKKFL